MKINCCSRIETLTIDFCPFKIHLNNFHVCQNLTKLTLCSGYNNFFLEYVCLKTKRKKDMKKNRAKRQEFHFYLNMLKGDMILGIAPPAIYMTNNVWERKENVLTFGSRHTFLLFSIINDNSSNNNRTHPSFRASNMFLVKCYIFLYAHLRLLLFSFTIICHIFVTYEKCVEKF